MIDAIYDESNKIALMTTTEFKVNIFPSITAVKRKFIMKRTKWRTVTQEMLKLMERSMDFLENYYDGTVEKQLKQVMDSIQSTFNWLSIESNSFLDKTSLEELFR